jgi:hypothetical protein
MCNLYSLTKGQAAIRDWFRASHDRTGSGPDGGRDAFDGRHGAMKPDGRRRCKIMGRRIAASR